MFMDDELNRYELEFASFKLGSSEKWCPKVLIKDLGSNKIIPLLWEEELNSEEDANEFANNSITDFLAANLYNN